MAVTAQKGTRKFHVALGVPIFIFCLMVLTAVITVLHAKYAIVPIRRARVKRSRLSRMKSESQRQSLDIPQSSVEMRTEVCLPTASVDHRRDVDKEHAENLGSKSSSTDTDTPSGSS